LATVLATLEKKLLTDAPICFFIIIGENYYKKNIHLIVF